VPRKRKEKLAGKKKTNLKGNSQLNQPVRIIVLLMCVDKCGRAILKMWLVAGQMTPLTAACRLSLVTIPIWNYPDRGPFQKANIHRPEL